MEEFLQSLNIFHKGSYSNKNYIIELLDSVDYDKVLNKLDKSDKVEEDTDSVNINMHSATNIYYSDDYEIIVGADFDNDTYKLTIKEI